MFLDKVQITVTGGRGGNGCVAFRREKFVPRGGPDGGDGGDGGSVILRASGNEQTLLPLKYKNHREAGNGVHGQGKRQHGKRGKDVLVPVPLGTIIRDLDRDNVVLADLTAEDMEFTAAGGGRGGRGNAKFATSVNRSPRQSELGADGEERHLELELKLLADVGLVGFPNAGKSTFLAAISNAKPKAAAYPFTTLHPHVGIVESDDYSRMTVADIPGLLEGAHEDVGLGHEFLRHIERTKALVYMLDMSGLQDKSPLEQLRALQKELECHKEGLSQRPALIVANKMDEDAAEKNLKQLKRRARLPICPISALLGTNVPVAVETMRSLLSQA